MRRAIQTSLALLLTMFVGVGCSGVAEQQASTSQEATAQEQPVKQEEQKTITLGITQIVEHPALDSVRKGIVDALADKGFKDGENLNVDLQNAQGDMNNAISIAQKFTADQKDMIVAIATPTAQAAAKATKDIPIVFATVTDPVAAGLVEALDKPGDNITGTSDQLPMAMQVDLIKKFIPGVKKIGVIYSSSEVNSEVQVKDIEASAKERNIGVEKVGITKASEVQSGAEALAGKVDAILIPVDNTVVSAMEGVVTTALKAKLPVFASDTDSVKRGAVATYGIDYYKMGYQTGEMAARILKGEATTANPVEVTKDADLTINLDSAKAFGLQVSDELKKSAKEVIGE
ncbi:ABC transporter substrate-binding protein [Ammoniphilus resinae]|uniref:ABC transport system substrate-binding protein n=1 Tax=Ammoniphilus resinae TaxID=861532 RepID=A0ABS4GJR4_9BACL|nr:ABC transporter substrate-binding protein [Ammoniphilus resinae]MBP1930489.1 putative ABC transport system substrate-binding protein [Ammoniphilus resinae]